MSAALVGLVVLLVLDGAFAGFRASCGRTGLVRHGRADVLAGVRGVALDAVLLVPAAVTAVVAASTTRGGTALASAAGTALAVVGPYAVAVLVALGAYLVLPWRYRFLASALALGPLTFARPWVATVVAVVVLARTDDTVVALASALTAAAVVVVEPLAGAAWYEPRQVSPGRGGRARRARRP